MNLTQGPKIVPVVATAVQKKDSGINTNYYFGDREPCWFATVEKADDPKNYKWHVGCIYADHTDEGRISFSDIGNVKDKNLWKKINGVDFAIRLIELFKIGGIKEIRKCINDGSL